MKLKSLPFLCLSILMSCQVTSELEVSLDNPKMVMDVRQHPDSTFIVVLHHSISPQDYLSDFATRLENATVQIFEDEVLLETLQQTVLPSHVYYSEVSKPILGKNYRIEATASGYLPISSTTSPMDSVSLNGYSVSDEPIIVGVYQDNSEQKAYLNSVNFSDPINVKNFYRFAITMRRSGGGSSAEKANGENIIYSSTGSISGISPLNDNYLLNLSGKEERDFYAEVFFTDETFDGQNTNFEFYTIENLVEEINNRINPEEWFDNQEPLSFILQNISETHYNYSVSSEYQKIIANDPFAEPFFIEGNVEGGIGLFSIFGESSIIIRDAREE